MVNAWYNPFYDLIQQMLSHGGGDVTLLGCVDDFTCGDGVCHGKGLNSFFVSHYVFRWRTAMNEYYTANWEKLRHIEGASQRIQEDTMRFAKTMEGLGVSLVEALMTLLAFMPVLFLMSSQVQRLADCRRNSTCLGLGRYFLGGIGYRYIGC